MSLRTLHVEVDGPLVFVIARRTNLTGREVAAVSAMLRYSYRVSGGVGMGPLHTRESFAWLVEFDAPQDAESYAGTIAEEIRR